MFVKNRFCFELTYGSYELLMKMFLKIGVVIKIPKTSIFNK